MRVLVTGGAGFIGSHLVDLLVAQGLDLCVIDDLSSGSELNLLSAKKLAKELGQKLSLIQGDISQKTTWEKIEGDFDAFFHLAAQTSVTYSVKNPELDFQSNVQSVLHISRFLRERKVRHFIYANTAGALYGPTENVPTPETEALRPLSPYGATKSFMETYISSLASSLKGSGEWSSDPHQKNYFSWTSLRLGNIYGPRQTTKGEAGVIPIFIEEISNSRAPCIFGDGSKTRDYLYIDDVVLAFKKAFALSQNEVIDDAFNVGSGIETSDQQVFDEVFKAIKTRATEKGESFWPKQVVPRKDHVRPGEVHQSCLDTNKIFKKMMFKSSMDFSKGVLNTVLSYEILR